jgi:hypothetical protein
MMLRLFYAGALALVCMVFPVAHANTTPITVSTEKLHELANSAYWKLLLRYEPARTQSGVQSEARSSHYFLADTGRDSPLNELKALIAAVAAPEIDNNHAACRFPARTRWLYQQIGISAPDFSCPAYDEWRGLINPQQATLVFASDYLNNPSSMFGHTFLRLDAPGQTEDTRLLAYAVNYAAQADAKNPFTFAYKGLTGGYPGVFSLMPYYEKVKEYSDMENRDLWEYQLSLAPDEVRLTALASVGAAQRGISLLLPNTQLLFSTARSAGSGPTRVLALRQCIPRPGHSRPTPFDGYWKSRACSKS